MKNKKDLSSLPLLVCLLFLGGAGCINADLKVMSSNLQNSEASLQAEPASRFFISGNNTVHSGNCENYSIESQDSHGNPSLVTSNTSVALMVTPSAIGSGTLYSDSACNTLLATSITIPQGSNRQSFYFKGFIAGSLNLTASGSLDPASLFVTVNPGNPATLEYTLQPHPSPTAGISFSTAPVVTVRDSAGNTVTNATNSISLSAFTNPSCTTAATGTLTATTLPLSPNNGVAAFTGVQYTKAETIHLKASASGVNSTCSNPITISANSPSKLAFSTQPSSTNTAGANLIIQPSIIIQDLYGNSINSSASITIAIGTNPSAGSIAGTTTKNAVSGIVNYSGLSIDKSGDGYTLVATSSGLTSATSDSLNIQSKPTISLSNASANEGNPIIFTVTQSAARATITTFTYTTTAQSAVAGADYTTTSGIANIVAGSTSVTVSVPTLFRANYFQGNKDFTLTLSSPVNADLGGTTTATGSITETSPQLLTVSPYSGELAGGTSITLSGNNFASGGSLGVTIGGSACTSISIASSTSLTCNTTAGTIGTFDILLTNGDGQTANLNPGFTYTYPQTWTDTALGGAPNARFGHTAIWTGSKMIIWGGGDITGKQFDAVANSWSPVSTSNAPAARFKQTAVWAGSKMIVWGGEQADGSLFNDGGIYDPVSNVWVTIYNSSDFRTHHSAVWTGSKMIVWGGKDSAGSYLNSGYAYELNTNSWSAINSSGAPSARENHTLVWTGSEMIVWGGFGGGNNLNDGGKYNPVSNAWSSVTTSNAPQARVDHTTAVWTGSKMIIWGGELANGTLLNDGGQYDPVANSWLTLPVLNAPVSRKHHSAVWTGSKMIIWGGHGGSDLNSGAYYDPATNMWLPVTSTSAPAGREKHTAVWTGSKMIVWGGYSSTSVSTLNSGGILDPGGMQASNTWLATSITEAPTPRKWNTAIWTGSKMIVWGGDSGSTSLNTGGRYDPISNSWSAITTSGAPSERYFHTAVWTGSQMIIWGGDSGTSHLNSGGRYNPVTDSWLTTSTSTAPQARKLHSAVWTGTMMIIWGGYNGIAHFNSGGRYDPVTDSWLTTSTTIAPSSRRLHTALWTGSKMIIWGGIRNNGGPEFLNDGGLYDPIANLWESTAMTTGAPPVRAWHTAVWTGSKMIVWGGHSGSAYLNDGKKYDPIADSWDSMDTSNAPSNRDSHTAIWTGSKMIIWGGENGANSYLNNGGQYNPISDSWGPITTTNVPSERHYHTAIWTGSIGDSLGGSFQYNLNNNGDRGQMIIWGGENASGTVNTGGIYQP